VAKFCAKISDPSKNGLEGKKKDFNGTQDWKFSKIIFG